MLNNVMVVRVACVSRRLMTCLVWRIITGFFLVFSRKLNKRRPLFYSFTTLQVRFDLGGVNSFWCLIWMINWGQSLARMVMLNYKLMSKAELTGKEISFSACMEPLWRLHNFPIFEALISLSAFSRNLTLWTPLLCPLFKDTPFPPRVRTS